jgi:hypothetical protein
MAGGKRTFGDNPQLSHPAGKRPPPAAQLKSSV